MQFWMGNSPNSNSIDLAKWISSQLFGLADALQLIRDLFPTEVITESGHGLLPPHRDLSPESILCFSTSTSTGGVLKIADFGSMQFHDEQLYHQRGSGSCVNSTYRAPEIHKDDSASDSDLWSLGYIILHFITWSYGGWERVESLSTLSCNEEEESGAFTREDKFFMYSNSNTTILNLDSERLTQRNPDGTAIGPRKDLSDSGPVLKESVQIVCCNANALEILI
jgi:serine/threonine protein kinase